MIKRISLLLFIGLAFWSCEDADTIPPTVTITLPQDGTTVSDSITITCISSDDEGVAKVELWVNGVSTGVTDDTEPYSLDWNTTTYEGGSYVITVRSYDTSGNTTDSDPITLTVVSCPDLTTAFTDATAAWTNSMDLTAGTFGATECAAMVAAYKAGLDAGCAGFTQADYDDLVTLCNS